MPNTMMTLGRLRAIEAYWARQAASTSLIHANELIAEVKRLRDALKRIAVDPPLEATPTIESMLNYVQRIASEALREPDLGPPDIVCRRETKP